MHTTIHILWDRGGRQGAVRVDRGKLAGVCGGSAASSHGYRFLDGGPCRLTLHMADARTGPGAGVTVVTVDDTRASFSSWHRDVAARTPLNMREYGAVLWNIGEHYRYTRDLDWVRGIPGQIRRACEYLLAQRERNRCEELRGKGYGMLEGKVADPEDPYHSYMLKCFACLGLKRSAEVLAQVVPVDAARYRDEAAARCGLTWRSRGNGSSPPRTLRIRLPHPEGARATAVSTGSCDPTSETVQIPFDAAKVDLEARF